MGRFEVAYVQPFSHQAKLDIWIFGVQKRPKRGTSSRIFCVRFPRRVACWGPWSSLTEGVVPLTSFYWVYIHIPTYWPRGVPFLKGLSLRFLLGPSSFGRPWKTHNLDPPSWTLQISCSPMTFHVHPWHQSYVNISTIHSSPLANLPIACKPHIATTRTDGYINGLVW